MDNFTQDIKDLEVTTVERARQAIENKENATFFIGRKTCPYCRKFATTLASVVAETQAYIFFINSEEPSELEELQAFHTENSQVAVRCDSSMTADEIKTFANL